MGFSRKKIVPPMLRISIFLELTPLDFQSILPWLLWNFRKFSISLRWPPLKSTFFPQILVYPPWNSNDFYSTPLEFSIDILNRGGYGFFLKKPILSTPKPISVIILMSFNKICFKKMRETVWHFYRLVQTFCIFKRNKRLSYYTSISYREAR